jgi:hypothetical protein
MLLVLVIFLLLPPLLKLVVGLFRLVIPIRPLLPEVTGEENQKF